MESNLDILHCQFGMDFFNGASNAIPFSSILFRIEINYTSSCHLPFPQFLDSVRELADRILLIYRFQQSLE